jgi:hypothetical protein
MALITDYTDLHVEVIAGDVTVPCCPNPLPAVLRVTFTGDLGGTWLLLWDGTTSTWQNANVTLCAGLPSTVLLNCVPGGWDMRIQRFVTGPACATNPTGADSFTCDPLSITWSSFRTPLGCCFGLNFGATVTA